MRIRIDATPIDTLTVKFWRDQPGPPFDPDKPAAWACYIGPDFIGGVGGFGPTPLAALRHLCDEIGKYEGHRSAQGKILLR